MSQGTYRPTVGTLRAFVKPLESISPVTAIAKNKGYFLIRIHAAQVSYTGGLWMNLRNAAKQVIVTSEVELKPWVDEPIRHIQVVRRMRPNQAVQLGLRSNLTDFIPATVDKVSIKLNLLLDQKDRLESLSNAINNSGFLTTISLSEPVLATAKALGKASRCILDAFLEAETKKPILEFTGDFNVGTPDLRSGYHVFLATTDKGSPLPAHDAHYSVEGTTLLVDQQPATRWSYVILEVMCSEARDRNPQANWDKLLREAEAAASEFARNAAFLDANQMKAKQKAAIDKCQALITKAETLLQADPNYVSEERSRIIAASFKDYTDKITGIATTRRYGAPASRVHNRWISDARLALGLPKDAELNQVLLRYAEQVQGFRVAETARAKKDEQADDVRRKIEESDLVALGNDVTAITPGATLV